MNVPNHEKKTFKDLTPEERSVIVEAWLDGKAEVYYPTDDMWVDKADACIYNKSIYRTRQRQFVIPWEHIKPEYKWAALNRNGNLHVYTDQPYNFSNQWISPKGYVSAGLSAINIDTTGIDWRESLVQRPEGV